MAVLGMKVNQDKSVFEYKPINSHINQKVSSRALHYGYGYSYGFL